MNMIRDQRSRASLSAQDVYLREVRWIPSLTEDEEARLQQCLVSNIDVQQARDRLVEGYQTLIISLARRFVRHCRHLELLDLVQEGSEGLLQAISSYHVSKGESPFKMFAFAWIRGKMLMALWQNERIIRLPFDKVRAIRQLGVITTQLLSVLGREPTCLEMAQAMGMKERDVLELVALQKQEVVSLQACPTDDDDLPIEDIIPDSASATLAHELSSSLDTLLERLPERERIIIRLRYGLHDGQPYSQREVAGLLGISLSTVAALDRRAHMRLRKALSA
jgi:RNA polymerase sigma factor (sigma-70 family)